LPITAFIVEKLRGLADRLDAAATRRNACDSSRSGAGPVLDEYIVGMPGAQNAVNILPGWHQSFPPAVGVVAGDSAFYQDPRIAWALERYGSLENQAVLELGPLEGGHTYFLEQQNPAFIHAIEANKLSFLRCLIAKEILGMSKAKFFIGDLMQWLHNTEVHYDLIVASGVLYHMQDPLLMLELMGKHTNAFYLWTHYMSDAAMPQDDPRRGALIGDIEVHDFHGLPVRLSKRSYYGAWRDKSFCGGVHDIHRWIEKDDLVAAIRALGFTDVRIAHDEPDHRNGPAFSVFARREA